MPARPWASGWTAAKRLSRAARNNLAPPWMQPGRPTVKLRKARRTPEGVGIDVNTTVSIFVIVAAVAIVVQMGILIALYVAMRQTASRVEGIAGRLEQQASPLLSSATAI